MQISENELLLADAEKQRMLKVLLSHDEPFFDAARGIVDILAIPGEMQLDFADVQHCLDTGDLLMVGTGIAAGAEDIGEAVSSAISNPLFGSQALPRTRRALLNIVNRADLEPEALEEVLRTVQHALPEDVELLVGSVTDMNSDDEIRITLLAFGDQEDVDPSDAKSI